MGLTWGDLSQETLGNARDIYGCHYWGCSWHRVGGHQGCGSTSHGVQMPPQSVTHPDVHTAGETLL